MRSVVCGILAHVDAGKTTLSESLLFHAGAIRHAGRVDHGDTFLDTDPQERKRGITIYAKQAALTWKDTAITFVDTPGHADFSAEVERTLPVLDCCILLISAPDGVQSHTITLWRLISESDIPCFVFVNKMDLTERSHSDILEELSTSFHADFADMESEDRFETIATADEDLLSEYLETGTIRDSSITGAFMNRRFFPVLFGSALRSTGTEALLDMLDTYILPRSYPGEFGALVYKVARDKAGVRWTYLKVTGGSLKVKDMVLPNGAYPDEARKVNEIRLVSGEKTTGVQEIPAGGVCAVTGLDGSFPGQGLGITPSGNTHRLIPVLSYKVIFPKSENVSRMLAIFKELEDEDPMLAVSVNDRTKEISISIMGKIQLEVLRDKVKERFDKEVDFGTGDILYRETIALPSIGHGHYEPLKHFADVVLELEPLPIGSGIVTDSILKNEELGLNFQHQILNRIKNRDIAGVLTGSPLTDVKITITGGRSHKKHTEGGDFRRATVIALRDALLRTDSILLEPFYHVTLDIPRTSLGRAMNDLERMHGNVGTPEVHGERCIVTGDVPVSLSMDYASEVSAYTGGLGNARMELAGFFPCHNAEEVIQAKAYDFMTDLNNPYLSIYVHSESPDDPLPFMAEDKKDIPQQPSSKTSPRKKELSEDDELMEIFVRTFGEIRRPLPQSRTVITSQKEERVKQARQSYLESHPAVTERLKQKTIRKDYLLVDGYNVIFSWKQLKELAEIDIASARDSLLDMMCNYQGYTGCILIVVFDAYKVRGGLGSHEKFKNIHVVYTKEAQTADAYIEKATHEIAEKGNADVRVVTSDGMVQLIVLGAGAIRISAREFEGLVENAGK